LKLPCVQNLMYLGFNLVMPRVTTWLSSQNY